MDTKIQGKRAWESSRGNASGMRVGMLLCVLFGGAVGMIATCQGKVTWELVGLVGVYVSAGIAGKVAQKAKAFETGGKAEE